jgi:hypothetical protein
VSDAAGVWAQHFTVTYSGDELWAFSKLLSKRYARRDDSGTYFGLAFVAIFAIGLIIFAAFELGLIAAAALKPVLVTAYAAFVGGATSYWLTVRRQSYAFYRSFAPESRTWHYSFDDTGISYKNGLRQTHLRWRAVNSVEDLDRAVMFPTGESAVFLPSRVFTDTTMRTTFVAASAARIKAAREGPKTESTRLPS